LESLEGRDYSEDLGADGSILLKLILRKYGWGVGFIHVAWDREGWPAVVSTVITFGFHHRQGIY
jgi:hypothetical protein